MLIVTPSTLLNPGILAARRVPKALIGRGLTILPRGTVLRGVFWRLMLEFSFLRYAAVLFPFPLAALIWPQIALPISGAPLVMFLVVLYIEGNVLSIPTAARRRALIDRAQAERGLDLLTVRARDIATRIAAGRGLTSGSLTLVVEQSLMARFAPLTLVSVQQSEGDAVLDLDAEETELIRALFAEGLDERLLHRINLSENAGLRSVTVEAAGISAHARLAALARPAPLSARG